MIIGIAGKKRSSREHGGACFRSSWVHLDSFAEPIRSFVSMLINEELPTETRRPIGLGLTARQLMQTVRTEWGRSEHPEIWVRR